jgi:dihydroneopterin aldolase/2-amino-4-hydroxy-6-hydroxymethyldihydropteridine diphosphokinase
VTLDRISLLGLRAFGRHGVLARERAEGQEFVIDAVLWVDTRGAAEADDLSLTVDYGVLADRLARLVSGPPAALIETLAARLADACLEHRMVRQVEITVHKPHAPVGQPVRDITVAIRRQQADRSDHGDAAGGSPAEAGAAAGSEADGRLCREVVLSVGSNLGDRLANLQRGIDVLCCGGGLSCSAVSAVYETAPVGGPEQGDYLNAVLLARSALPPAGILQRCQAAEAELGRVRAERFGPRTLDVDIVAIGAEQSADPAVTLPHPRAHERAFVLVPWLDVQPDAVVPGRGPAADLLAEVGRGGVRRLPGARLAVPAGGPQAAVAAGDPEAVTR